MDGPNGLRFNTSLATGDIPGSPAQSQSDRLQQAINPSKAVFTIEPNTSKVFFSNTPYRITFACNFINMDFNSVKGVSPFPILTKCNSITITLH